MNALQKQKEAFEKLGIPAVRELQDQVRKMQKQVDQMENRARGLLALAGSCLELYGDLAEWAQTFKLTYADDVYAHEALDAIMVKLKGVFKTYVEVRD